MKNERLFRAVGAAKDEFLTECEKDMGRKLSSYGWLKWGEIAACLCLVVVAAVALYAYPWSRDDNGNIADNRGQDEQTVDGNAYGHEGKPSGSLTPDGDGIAGQLETATPKVIQLLEVNELDEEPSLANGGIALFVQDYVPMTDEAFMAYFGVTIPVDEAVPDMILQEQDAGSGIYKNDERGVYFDNHSFRFANADASRGIIVALAKDHLPQSDINEAYGQVLQESEINGVAMTIAHYAGQYGLYVEEATSDSYYAEFMFEGNGYAVTSGNLTEAEFVAILTALVS